MKTKEELQQLKEEYEALCNKLKELTEEELKLVNGGYSSYHMKDEEMTAALTDLGNKAYAASKRDMLGAYSKLWYHINAAEYATNDRSARLEYVNLALTDLANGHKDCDLSSDMVSYFNSQLRKIKESLEYYLKEWTIE